MYLKNIFSLGDGNCAIHAILDQMTYDREHRHLKLTHKEFRRLIANSLEENVQNGHIHWDLHARGCSIEAWVKKYSRVGCYVGEVFLRLASTFLNRKIVLFPVNPYNQDQPAKKLKYFLIMSTVGARKKIKNMGHLLFCITKRHILPHLIFNPFIPLLR